MAVASTSGRPRPMPKTGSTRPPGRRSGKGWRRRTEAMVSSDLFVEDVVVALAGVREAETGEVIRSRRGRLVPSLRRRVPAELRGDDVRVRWDSDRVETWYPAPLLVRAHALVDRTRRE